MFKKLHVVRLASPSNRRESAIQPDSVMPPSNEDTTSMTALRLKDLERSQWDSEFTFRLLRHRLWQRQANRLDPSHIIFSWHARSYDTGTICIIQRHNWRIKTINWRKWVWSCVLNHKTRRRQRRTVRNITRDNRCRQDLLPMHQAWVRRFQLCIAQHPST